MTNTLTLSWPCNEETHKGQFLGYSLFIRYSDRMLAMYKSRTSKWITKKDIVGGARAWWIEKP